MASLRRPTPRAAPFKPPARRWPIAPLEAAALTLFLGAFVYLAVAVLRDAPPSTRATPDAATTPAPAGP